MSVHSVNEVQTLDKCRFGPDLGTQVEIEGRVPVSMFLWAGEAHWYLLRPRL